MTASDAPPPTPPPAPLLRLRGVDKLFDSGALAVAKLDLDLREGEFLSLLGPSGCGKSTTLRLIAGLAPPTAGEIIWRDGVAPQLGFVFQSANLTPWNSVFENVYLPLRLQGFARSQVRGRVNEVLARVGLEGREKTLPRQLSGGMAMRVSIARALVARPRVLLMDEPFAALDEPTRLRLNADLSALAFEEKMSVIFVTHSVFESVALSSRIAVFSRGPGRVAEEIAINAPSPRGRDFRLTPEFSNFASQVGASLRMSSGEDF